MAVTITGNDGVTFTFLEAEINGVRSRIAGDIDAFSLLGSGPASAFLYTIGGPSKQITIRGRLIEAGTTRTSSGTTTTILQQKQWLEKQLDGAQILKTFSSNYEGQSYGAGSYGNTKGFVGTIEFDEQEGMPQELPFTMTLLVGGS